MCIEKNWIFKQLKHVYNDLLFPTKFVFFASIYLSRRESGQVRGEPVQVVHGVQQHTTPQKSYTEVHSTYRVFICLYYLYSKADEGLPTVNFTVNRDIRPFFLPPLFDRKSRGKR